MQLKSLITILNHTAAFSLSSSSFVRNSGTRGIVNVELAFQSTSGVLIFGNRFERNSAMFDANVLTLRKRVFSLVHDEYFDVSQLECGGFHIANNTFSYNVGCRNTIGAIKAYCMEDKNALSLEGRAPHPNITYDPIVDQAYFNRSLFSAEAAGSDPDGLPGSLNEDNELAYATYEVLNQTILVNLFRMNLISNTYHHNFAGNQRSVVEVEGVPIVYSFGEVYSNNENWFQHAYLAYSQFRGLQAVGSTPEELPKLNASALAAYPFKARSILYIWRASHVRFDTTKFIANFVVDDLHPNSSFHLLQSHSFFLRDFSGQLIFQGNSSFDKNKGISGSLFMSQYLDESYQFHGFKSFLFNFDRFLLSKLLLVGVEFNNNQAYRYKDTFTHRPLLFNVSRSYFANQAIFLPTTTEETRAEFL